MSGAAYKFLKALGRKKTVNVEGTHLSRVLNLFDITFIGLGAVLGLGTFVLPGSIAKHDAGPAVLISFVIAGIASVVAGICYAEFASRVPRSGSAYAYSYFTIGEFVAYIIGWDLILEYVIGTAGLARGLSDYVNALTNNTISDVLAAQFPVNVSFLSRYPDFLAFSFLVLLTAILCVGVKESVMMNNILTGIEMLTILVIIVAGFFGASLENWTIPADEVPPNAGGGGFFPFGLTGIMVGAAKSFFAFVGFDAIATASDETINPRKNIPIGISLCLVLTFIAYMGVSSITTLMMPYYELSDKAPFPYAFESLGWTEVKWIATTGCIFAIASSLVGGMFALPRIFYAMGSDGLTFEILARVNKRTKTPLIATLTSGFFAGIMTLIFDVNQLVEMLSIGTLMAYTIVAICILILRYEEEPETVTPNTELTCDPRIADNLLALLKHTFNLNGIKRCNNETSLITNWSIFLFILGSVLVNTILIYGPQQMNQNGGAIFGLVVGSVIGVLALVAISRQPMSETKPSFMVPFVPLTPCISIFINIHLMLNLSMHTWIRLIVWQAVGFIIYFSYGINHSHVGLGTKEPATDAKKTNSNEHNREVYKEITKF